MSSVTKSETDCRHGHSEEQREAQIKRAKECASRISIDPEVVVVIRTHTQPQTHSQ